VILRQAKDRRFQDRWASRGVASILCQRILTESVTTQIIDSNLRSISFLTTMAEVDANAALALVAEGTKQVTKTKKRRPARKQVEAKKLADQAPKQTGHTYNIWYSKWSGGDTNDPFAAKEHADTRCDIAKDSGYTRADRTPGSYFCLFFARGMCPNGYVPLHLY
jgi:hypothetical protein